MWWTLIICFMAIEEALKEKSGIKRGKMILRGKINRKSLSHDIFWSIDVPRLKESRKAPETFTRKEGICKHVLRAPAMWTDRGNHVKGVPHTSSSLSIRQGKKETVLDYVTRYKNEKIVFCHYLENHSSVVILIGAK